MARDAQTSGDPVAAESYLQHAEHYFRIIAAAQQAQYQAQTGIVRAGDDADDGEDDDDPIVNDRFALPSERIQLQPVQAQPIVPPPVQQGPVDRANGQERSERQDRPEGQDRPYRQDRYGADRDRGNQGRAPQPGYERQQDRGGQDRNFRNDRGDRNTNRPRLGQDGRDNRDDRDTRDMQFREQPRLPPVAPEPRPQPVVAEVEAGPDLPAFITAPVRTVTPMPEPLQEPESPAATAAHESEGSDELVLRPRRRRRARMVTPSELDAPREADLPPEE